MLTGARREELAALKWADVDFQWKRLTIRDKVEGERIIPLTPYVGSLLLDLGGGMKHRLLSTVSQWGNGSGTTLEN